MRLSFSESLRRRSISLALGAVLLVMAAAIVGANPPAAELSKMFPAELEDFHQTQLIRPLMTLVKEGSLRPEYFTPSPDTKSQPPFVGGEAEYVSTNGDKLLLELVSLKTDSAAYSLLTLAARRMKDASDSPVIRNVDVGTACVVGPRSVAFFRGTTFARVTNESSSNSKPVFDFARSLAATFDKGEDEVPVLVKHLPDWQAAQLGAVYAVNTGALRDAVPNQPVLDALDFEGGTEAVIANYGQSKLVIVEFTTPQFSVDNDQRIWTEISELKRQNQPVPTGYRRVGNYSVFVFNAPDEKSASELIDQVKYEQVVQWLGDDPHLYERLKKYLTQTSAGVLIAVLKSSGLSLIFCLAAGAFIGALLFRHRRSQKAAAYSDAGGAIRLNLDELTGPSNSQRLLTGDDQSKSDSANP